MSWRYLAGAGSSRSAPRLGALDARNTVLQHARVRVLRSQEDVLDIALLDDVARMHQVDAVTDLGYEVEIVRDEQHGEAELFAQLPQQRHDLCLDRYIEGRRWLVRDEKFGPPGDGERNHDALAHAAREFVRIAREPAAGFGDADEFEHLDRPVAGCFARGGRPVRADGIDELLTDGEGRVERAQRVLEHHGDLATAHGAHRLLVEGGQIAALEQYLAAGDPARLRHQPHYGQRAEALAGARRADDADRLARRHREAHPAHGLGHAVRHWEGDSQVADVEQKSGHVRSLPGLRRGSGKSRRRSE